MTSKHEEWLEKVRPEELAGDKQTSGMETLAKEAQQVQSEFFKWAVSGATGRGYYAMATAIILSARLVVAGWLNRTQEQTPVSKEQQK